MALLRLPHLKSYCSGLHDIPTFAKVISQPFSYINGFISTDFAPNNKVIQRNRNFPEEMSNGSSNTSLWSFDPSSIIPCLIANTN